MRVAPDRRVALRCAGLLVLVGLAGPRAGAQSWSPNGHWLAYAIDDSWNEATLRPGWLYGPPQVAPVDPDHPEERTPPRWRLWATRVETGESVALAESDRPISQPGWNPAGSA